MHVDLIKLYGSMELAPLVGLADAIVDLVSTGNTLKANDLVAVEDIMPISSRLVVNPGALKMKRDVVQPLLEVLARVAQESRKVSVMSTPLPIRRLDTSATGFDAELAALTVFEAGQDEGIDATVAQSSATSVRAVMPHCWNTRAASTISTPPQWPTWKLLPMRCAMRTPRCPPRNAMRWRRRGSCPRVPRTPAWPRLELYRGRRHGTGPARDAARPRRRLRSGGKAAIRHRC